MVGVTWTVSVGGESTFLRWTYPTEDPVAGFNVYRSDDGANFNKVNVSVIYAGYFLDTAFGYRFMRRAAYQVRDSGTGKVLLDIKENFLSLDMPQRGLDLSALVKEIIRRKGILQQWNAEDCFFLFKRISGVRCPKCWSDERKVPTSTCNRCYGTGFDGGFVSLRSKARFLSVQERFSLSKYGLILDKRPTIWLADYPLIEKGDYVVRINGDRFVVSDIRRRSIKSNVTQQVVTLDLMPPNDIISRYPVEWS